MADIFHYFPVNASPDKIFKSISTPAVLDCWWTEASKGVPATGEVIELFFGQDYHWAGVVSRYEPFSEFELTITKSDNDWMGTRVGFRLINKDDYTQVEFYHTGWPEPNEHYRISNFCWAMYLRILKRYIENNEMVAYEERLNV